jgi:uncharacterized radical SAM superfamily Fe-S cluster-containing enzyme
MSLSIKNCLTCPEVYFSNYYICKLAALIFSDRERLLPDFFVQDLQELLIFVMLLITSISNERSFVSNLKSFIIVVFLLRLFYRGNLP